MKAPTPTLLVAALGAFGALVVPRARTALRSLGAFAIFAQVLGAPRAALAQEFARPPAEAVAVTPTDYDHVGYDHATPVPQDFYHPRSTVRLGVGPTVRAANGVDGGLLAAMEVGEGPAGARFSGTWIGVGGDGGLSEYDGELWLDFGHLKRLHPIVGAGAGAARVESRAPAGGTDSATVGVGHLRVALHYLLPVDGTDARAGLEVVGVLPAIRGESGPDLSPWALLSATVSVGF